VKVEEAAVETTNVSTVASQATSLVSALKLGAAVAAAAAAEEAMINASTAAEPAIGREIAPTDLYSCCGIE